MGARAQSIGNAHDGFWVDTGTPIEYWRANMAALRGEFSLPFDGWAETSTMCKERGFMGA